jgi:hypothetical protein
MISDPDRTTAAVTTNLGVRSSNLFGRASNLKTPYSLGLLDSSILPWWYHCVESIMRTIMGLIKNPHGVYEARKKVLKILEEAVAKVLGEDKDRRSWLKRSRLSRTEVFA